MERVQEGGEAALCLLSFLVHLVSALAAPGQRREVDLSGRVVAEAMKCSG